MRLARGVRAWSVVERGMGMLGGGVVLASLVVGPYIASQSMNLGSREGTESYSPPREPAKVEIVESWGSEGFSELAEALADSPGEPTWESVRRLMEDGGWTKVRYAVRLRWTMTDGSFNDMTLLRVPYETDEIFTEFLALARQGHVEPDRPPPRLL